MTLSKKRIIIIGGTSGIGLATAKLAAENGASLVITGFQGKDFENIKSQINGDAEILQLDIADESAVKTFFDKIGKFDYLTTPGSAVHKGSFLQMDSKTAKAGFDSKFWGQYNAAKYAVPHINSGGAIVFFSGVISQRPQLNSVVMATVNSAVEGLGRALAVELAPIRVNVIAPGLIETPRYANLSEADRATVFANNIVKSPIKRLGQPQEIAEAILFLMTNTFMTGQTVFVDGGHLLS